MNPFVVNTVGPFNDAIARITNNITVIAGAADHQVSAHTAIESVIAAIAPQGIVAAVAMGVVVFVGAR